MGRYDSNGSNRTRNWATVFYDESIIQSINDLHYPCFISPCHDSDVNANGEVKKAHWHCLFNFDSVKSENQMREIIDRLGCVGLEQVQSNRSYGRYLCHLDNPEKHQYDINDVIVFGGLDYIELINSVADEFATLYEIVDYVLDNNVCNFRSFLLYCRQDKREWFEFLFRKKHLFDVKEIIKANLINKTDYTDDNL